jgi:hypothetical protein
MCVEKKERKIEKKERENKYMSMYEWKRGEKEKRGVAIRIREGWIKWKEK